MSNTTNPAVPPSIIDSYATPARKYTPGLGVAVANRTYNRNIDGYVEDWEDVSRRVSLGSAFLHPGNTDAEFHRMHRHMRQASVIMAGRHLQHGDEHQPDRNMEVYTNCSTAATSFHSFYLLLNGSGVGRAYDDALMVVDWRNMPITVPIIRKDHPDALSKLGGYAEINNYMDRREAERFYRNHQIIHFMVPDSREGWAQAVEIMESMAHQEIYRNHVLLLDFSDVRERGKPIAGMQDKPASGPGPTMKAISMIASVRHMDIDPWEQAMIVDHYLAESVLVGGIRRAARMATKSWRDSTISQFITIKQGGFLWSANNSVTVDGEFWADVRAAQDAGTSNRAYDILKALASAAYYDGTGEPGIINQHLLSQQRPNHYPAVYTSEQKYKLATRDPGFMKAIGQSAIISAIMMKDLSAKALNAKHCMITNPCGEIALLTLGGYCVIGDVVPYFAEDDDDAEDACRVCARALMRVNTLPSMYDHEVKRTNRIGVGLTGIHEWAWKRFGFGFRDLIDEGKSREFWMTLSRFKRAINEECESYSDELGMNIPHTNTTIKPSGTVSKLFNLSEGAHLPARREYLRWVQYRNDHADLRQYDGTPHPKRHLKNYKDTTIVGFPTQPEICKLDMGHHLVTAHEATPEEQYQWLRLLEKYWIHGVDEDGNLLEEETGNQVSYTLKYDPKKVSFDQFLDTLINGQSQVRACSVLPDADLSAYEYLPEEEISKAEYDSIVAALTESSSEDTPEDVDRAHVDCASGACPIEFSKV